MRPPLPLRTAQFGVTHCYTLECNYNLGRAVNALPPATNDGGRASPPQPASPAPVRYTPELWASVGRACLFGILELSRANPWTRLPRSPWRSLDAARKAVAMQARRSMMGERKEPHVRCRDAGAMP